MKELLPPWHGFGYEIAFDDMAPAKTAKLDWEVQKTQLSAHCTRRIIMIPDKYALIREPEGILLGFAGERTIMFQNAEVIKFHKEFFEFAGLRLNLVGSADNSKWIWSAAKTQYGFSIGPGLDIWEAYLLLAYPRVWGYTGRPLMLLVRKASQISYVMKLPTMGPRMKFATSSQWLRDQVKNAKYVLANLKKAALETELQFGKMSKITVDKKLLIAYITKMLFNNKRQGRQNPTRVLSSVPQVLDLLNSGPGLRFLEDQHSWYAVFCALSFYLDRVTGHNASASFFANWFGTRAVTKRNALDAVWHLIKDYDPKIETNRNPENLGDPAPAGEQPGQPVETINDENIPPPEDDQPQVVGSGG